MPRVWTNRLRTVFVVVFNVTIGLVVDAILDSAVRDDRRVISNWNSAWFPEKERCLMMSSALMCSRYWAWTCFGLELYCFKVGIYPVSLRCSFKPEVSLLIVRFQSLQPRMGQLIGSSTILRLYTLARAWYLARARCPHQCAANLKMLRKVLMPQVARSWPWCNKTENAAPFLPKAGETSKYVGLSKSSCLTGLSNARSTVESIS